MNFLHYKLPPPTLHQKLTGLYVIGVLCTIFLLIVLNIVAFPFIIYYQNSDPSDTVELFKKQAPRIALYLHQNPPALGDISAQIAEMRQDQANLKEAIRIRANGVVTDASGKVLLSDPPGAFIVGKPLVEQVTPREVTLITRALQGETDTRRLGIATRTGDNWVAVPAKDKENILRGVLFAQIHLEVRFWGMVKSVGEGWGPVIIVMFVMSLVSGTVFGSVMAQTLTRRLNTIATTASRWSRGDFAATAPEFPADELGLLSRRLNGMAQEMGELMVLRQELAATEERTRLGRDLHDTVKQHAFAAALQTATVLELLPADPIQGRLHVERTASLIERMQRDLMAILRDLNTDKPLPDPLDHLSDHLNTWSQETGIAVDTEIAPTHPLTTTAAYSLRRILDEALSNIIRHSGATCVSVKTQYNSTKGQLTLDIHDNGRGFVPNAVRSRSGGMGLGNMQARAQSLPGGTFELSSEPGQGTSIHVECRTENS